MPWTREDDNPAYHTAEYRRARLACLRAARWRCEVRIEGVCIGSATQADHEAGLATDPGHKTLRAACLPCHKHVTARQGGGFRRAPADPPPQPRTQW